jgi:hypothetical protein
MTELFDMLFAWAARMVLYGIVFGLVVGGAIASCAYLIVQ